MVLICYRTYVGIPQRQHEREMIENIISNHKQFVNNAMAEGNERKKELLFEMGSARSSSHVSSASSAAFSAQVRADAAAAKKKVEIQRKRSLAESQSAILSNNKSWRYPSVS